MLYSQVLKECMREAICFPCTNMICCAIHFFNCTILLIFRLHQVQTSVNTLEILKIAYLKLIVQTNGTYPYVVD